MALLALALSCSSEDGADSGGSGGASDAGAEDAALLDSASETGADGGPDAPDAVPEAAAPCPDDMVHVQDFCIDRYEAPNVFGEVPLVMYTFVESEAWCAQRGKRLCFDDERTKS